MGILDRISARQRITMGLVGLMIGTLLFASAFGFFPNEQKEILRGRARFCDALTITATAMSSAGNPGTLKATLEAVANRDDSSDNDVVSIGLRDLRGKLVYASPEHEAKWNPDETDTIRQSRSPVFRGGKPWAQLEVRFRDTGGLFGLNYWAPAWLLVVMVPVCFIQFSFYLRKTLKHLNPTDRVPQHVQDALDTLSVGLLLMDNHHRILFANSQFTEAIDRPGQDMFGEVASDLQWQTANDADVPWEVTAKTGESIEDQILQLQVGDRIRTFSVNCSKVGKGIMTTFDDISLLEEAREAALQASESKSAFLANMSHEIRTPLNAVLGFTDVLRRGLVSDSDESLDHLNMIHRSGKHLLELINDILDLSKIEAGKMEVEAIDTDVNQILSDTADVLKVKADENGLDLIVDYRTPLPCVMQSDPTRLKQIVTNLVGNAIKFTESGSVTIAAELQSQDDPTLRIEIIDTGIGMTPDQQARIFESFSQADETTTRKFGGTGLGLSISRRLSEALGGNLVVESEHGKGSTFIVTLPVDEAALENLTSVDELRQKGRRRSQTADGIIRLPAKHVLVVDDGEANRRLIELVLGRAGAVVTTAVNGLDAIKQLSDKDFELIFMDMQMPVLDGYSATERIRSVGLQTPIVALTGNAMKGDREKCLASGCTDFLSKPVDIDKLLALSAEFLGVADPEESASEPASTPQGEGVGNTHDPLSDEGDSTHALGDATTRVPKPAMPSQPHTSNQDLATFGDAELRFDGGKNEAADDGPIFCEMPMDDPELKDIVVDFLDRLGTRVDEISTAIEEAEFETVRSEAHWLKGAGGTLGFPAFTEPSITLEDAAKDSDADLAQQMLDTINDIRARIRLDGDEAPTGAAAIEVSPVSENDQTASTDPIPCALPLDDPEFAAIAADFVQRLDVRLEQMRQRCVEGDFVELAQDAHWLKGSGGTVGYAAFSEPAAALEAAAKRNDMADSERQLDAVFAVRQRIVVPELT